MNLLMSPFISSSTELENDKKKTSWEKRAIGGKAMEKRKSTGQSLMFCSVSKISSFSPAHLASTSPFPPPHPVLGALMDP